MTNDPFQHYDAAYVMGSLTPADRRAYEQHLAQCPRCSQAVSELAGVPGLMSKARPMDHDAATPPLPDTLLPKLLAARTQERGRRRWLLAGASAAAAAVVVVVLAVTLAVSGGSGGSDGPGGTDTGPPVELAFEQVIDSPVHAFGDLNEADWGTRIDINCTYDKGNGYEERSYKLVVSNGEGVREQVAVWKVRPGQDVALTGSTDLAPDEISAIDIVAADGTSLLRAKP